MSAPKLSGWSLSLARVRLSLAVGLVSSVLAALALWAGFTIAAQAATDCSIFPVPGLDFTIGVGYLVSLLPAMAVMWTLSLLASRVHVAAGLTTALLLSVAIVLLVVATHAFGLAPINMYECPAGAPPWWPW